MKSAPSAKLDDIYGVQPRQEEGAAGRVHMMTHSKLLVLAAIAGLPLLAYAVEPGLPRQGDSLSRAVFAAGRLWVLSSGGAISSISEDQDTWTADALPERAEDLCVRDGHPAVITGAADRSSWTLRQRSDDSWSVTAVIRRKRDDFRGLDCSGSGFIVLTSNRLVDVEDHKEREVRLSGRLAVGRVTSIYRTSDALFVGFYAGEWGGGLNRIDLRNGRITGDWRGRGMGGGEKAVEKFSCGPPNSCAAVNAIAEDPWKPGCIVVTFGLLHFVSYGRVAEVCETEVQPIYSKEYEGEGATPAERADYLRRMGFREGGPHGTVAFFGLVREGDILWAAANDGLYGIGPGGTTRFVPRPRFVDYGGIRVSYDLPQFVLVLTTINACCSVGAGVPLLVPR